MDTLAKETMGLPVFVCATTHQIVSSGTSQFSASTTTTTNPTSATTTSTTTPFFATATPTRSPTTPTFLPTASTATTSSTAQHQRRNTYTPPTFSSPTRRESLLSTHRLSQAFDFASSLAVGVLSKAADSVFGSDGAEQGGLMQEGIWSEDLEAGERERGREKKKDKLRFARVGDEGGFDGGLD